MPTRRPKAGYDFGEKRQYRRTIWACFRRAFQHRRFEAHCLLLPSLEGDEIDVAISNGFLEQNLHIVDDEKAVVAVLKRRYPRINTYGCRASVAVARIADKGIRLSCANFDFTNCVGAPVAAEIAVIADEAEAFIPGALAAFTLTRGLEKGSAAQVISSLGEESGLDFGRLEFLRIFLRDGSRLDGVTNDVELVTSGTYHSSGVVTLLWSIWRITGAFHLDEKVAADPLNWIVDNLSDQQRSTFGALCAVDAATAKTLLWRAYESMATPTVAEGRKAVATLAASILGFAVDLASRLRDVQEK